MVKNRKCPCCGSTRTRDNKEYFYCKHCNYILKKNNENIIKEKKIIN